MAIKSERELLEFIVAKVTESKALNGGFDKLVMMMEHMQQKQSEHGDKLDNLSKALYEPDEGLFARVKAVETTASNCALVIETHLKKDDPIVITEFKTFKENVETVAGKQLQELSAVVQTKKNMAKVYWALITSVLVFAGGILLQFVKHTP